MNEQNTTDQVSKITLILAIVITAIFTVGVLEWQGKIKHSEHKDEFALSTYRAVIIEKQEDNQYRLSNKPSNQTAVCHGGYLFISSDINEGREALLVDYKNRGVKCPPSETSE